MTAIDSHDILTNCSSITSGEKLLKKLDLRLIRRNESVIAQVFEKRILNSGCKELENFNYSSSLGLVFEGGSKDFFLSFNIDEKERGLCVKEDREQ